MMWLETAAISVSLSMIGGGSWTLPGVHGALEHPSVYPVQAQERPSDVQLQAAVAQALLNSPLTANSQIVVHVNQGEITLEGSAINPLAKREATRLAETVIGVREIRNRLSVVDTKIAEVPPE